MTPLEKAALTTYPDLPHMQTLVFIQAIHESGAYTKRGLSRLAQAPNYNLFGIKAKLGQDYVEYLTWENIKGKDIQVRAKFAKYASYGDAFSNHKRLMGLERYKRVMEADTLEEACEMIYVCGYATDPKYPAKLMAVYEEYLIRP